MNDPVVRLDEAGDGMAPSLAVAADVMSVAEAMDSQYLLRRSLSEPHADAEQLTQLVETLLAAHVSKLALSLLKVAAAQSWPSAEAMAGAVREEAVRVAWRTAIADGTVEESRLQVFDLLVLASRDALLATAVGDITRDLADRQELLTALTKHASPVATFCAHSAVSDHRGTFVDNLDRYLDELASLRGHCRAHVTTAIAMTPAQAGAMRHELERIFGRPIDLEADVDARVVGGALVNVDGDVIDGSIKARLDTARKALAEVPLDKKDGNNA